MKKLIASLILGLVTTITAEEIDFNETRFVARSDRTEDRPSFFYFRFAAAEGDVSRATPLIPGLGIGYRRHAGVGALDISMIGLGYAERKNIRYFWTAPKASYLHYFTPSQNESYYIGSGIAWGGVKSKRSDFVGLIPSLTVGYEFARLDSVLGFAEINLNQPAVAVHKRDLFPGMMAEITVGIGF